MGRSRKRFATCTAARACRASWLAEAWSLDVPAEAVAAASEAEASGRTAIVVAWDGEVRGVLSVGDTVKPSSAQAIARFRELGLRPVLLTGDNAGAAHAVAAAVGIDEVHAGVTPQGKLDVIRALIADGRTVAMVGDGVNDAAALAAADLGIAMGGGTDAAIAASDVTVVSGDLLVVADAIRLARRTLGTIKQAYAASLNNTLDEQLALEARLQSEIGRSHDFVEGVTAFLEKRPAQFTGE